MTQVPLTIYYWWGEGLKHQNRERSSLPGSVRRHSLQINTNNKRREDGGFCSSKKCIVLIENNKRRVESTEMDALRSSRISRKERIRNATIRQQIGLEKPIIKETEQNQLTWYGHVQRMAEGRLPKIAVKWMPKQKRA